jgi:hypothetical protein
MWEIIIYAIVLVLTVVLMPKVGGADAQKPASLADIDAPTAEPGRPIPVVFGLVLLKSANVVWYGDLDYQGVYA